MRRRIPYRVCSCTPNGVVTHLEARLLKDIVNSAIHPIRCAESCKWNRKPNRYSGMPKATTSLRVHKISMSIGTMVLT